MKVALVSVILSVAGIAIPAAAQALAQNYQLNIVKQPLDAALKDLAQQTGLQIGRLPDKVGSTSPDVGPIAGEMSADQALHTLLAPTRFTYKIVNDTTIAVLPVDANLRAAGHSADTQNPEATTAGSSEGGKEGKNSSSNGFRMAQAPAGSNQGAVSVETSVGGSTGTVQAGTLQEVVVTAQKRAERLIDTPQSVSVLSSDALEKIGATQFRDFANSVPGLNFTTQGAGYSQINMRGVTSGEFDVSPTVGIYVDDVPYGTSSAFADGAHASLDVALFDLERVEVLKGPQGTLYGASTMGGLIKYVTKLPDSARLAGDIQTGLAGTKNGGMSYNASGVLNAPLVTDKAALRVSTFETHDGGYIDNIAVGKKDVNRADIYGARLDLLVTPRDDLSVRVTGFLQNITRDGDATVDYTFGGIPRFGRQDQLRLFDEGFEQRFRLVSATLGYRLGWVNLTSISSYQTTQAVFTGDLPNYSGLCAYSQDTTCVSIGLAQKDRTDKFTQEVRLASASSAALEWVLGAYYTHESSQYIQAFQLQDAAFNLLPDDLYDVSDLSTYREAAGFGDLTWHLTSKFDVSGGVRYARNDQTYVQYGTGLLAHSLPEHTSGEGVFTYLANARYHFTDRSTGYLRYATGYRPGGPNIVTSDPVSGRASGPPTFGADRLRSYEAGYKAETTDHRFGVDVASYYIDWSNIQIAVIRNGFGAWANAPGGARIRGAELNLTARPVGGLLLGSALAYTDAYTRQANADIGASAGERLPNVPRFTVAVNADYGFDWGGLEPTTGATIRYRSGQFASFDASPGYPQYRLPAYASLDLRAGAKFGQVNAQLYVRNVLNREGELSAVTWRGPPQVAILQPRTIGLNLIAQF